jgi:hypothetical protein
VDGCLDARWIALAGDQQLFAVTWFRVDRRVRSNSAPRDDRMPVRPFNVAWRALLAAESHQGPEAKAT